MTTKLIERVGHISIHFVHKTSERRSADRKEWTEYQVREGRKVLSRHDIWKAAYADATARLQAHWDAIGEQLKKDA